jgi:hypothetical protein
MPDTVRSYSSLGLLLLACGPGPLPPENPKTHPDSPAPPITIQVEPSETSTPPATATSLQVPPPPKPVVIKDVGFETPESVLYLAEADSYLVSNISGSPTGLDNNGFISKLNSDGSVADLKFIAGGQAGVQLDAPKGMAVVGDVLYVADIAQLRRFDVKTGAPKPALRFPQATFLNDVAADSSGSIYVTDSGLKATPSGLVPNGSDAIYKVTGERVSVFAKGTSLGGPNGILVEGDNVLVVSFGKNSLTRFNAQGKVVATAELPSGGLDGVVALPRGYYLVSSWTSQAVYLGGFGEAFVAVASDLPSPADIGWSEKHQQILVPGFLGNDLRLIPFTVPSVAAGATTGAATAPAPATVGAAATPAPATAAASTAPAPKVPTSAASTPSPASSAVGTTPKP